jgi:hypothetical protein
MQDTDQEIAMRRNEADYKEFRNEMITATDGELSKDEIDLVFKNMGTAIGTWLNKSEKVSENEWHGQMRNGLVIQLRKLPAHLGTGVGEGTPIIEHFAIHTKWSQHSLDQMKEVLGLTVKNM